jgi:hypothetical protein
MVKRQLVIDLRWWSLHELVACEDTVYPAGLAQRLPDVIAGRHPPEPLAIPPGLRIKLLAAAFAGRKLPPNIREVQGWRTPRTA